MATESDWAVDRDIVETLLTNVIRALSQRIFEECPERNRLFLPNFVKWGKPERGNVGLKMNTGR